jgi:Reversibly glycosylated polypeptide
MPAPRAAIVVTTIFEPRFLDGYLENIERHGRRDSVDLFVIIDRKTPPTVAQACDEAARRGFRVTCPTLDEQETFLARFPSMRGRIPYDTDNRRNIGFLMALDAGAELLISIDDDNFVLGDDDFVGAHAVAGTTAAIGESESSDGWLNIGLMLEATPDIEIFPRGFPYFARKRPRHLEPRAPRTARVAMNAGLWLTDPDVDALTRIAIAPRVSAASPDAVFLGPRTWSPINTQNTALPRDAVAAYYYVRMGFSLGGLSIDRYGDILSGYFCQACVKARGEAVRIGSPVADHRRTPHNLFKDLYHELAGIVIIDDLLPWLQELPLAGSSYAELYASLADALEAEAPKRKGFIWDQGAGAFLRDTAEHMRAWLDAVAAIG